MGKKETVEEYLARGGKVVVLPKDNNFDTQNVCRPSLSKQAIALTLDEAVVLYGDPEVSKSESYRIKSNKKRNAMRKEINVDALPEALKRSLKNKLKEQLDEQ